MVFTSCLRHGRRLVQRVRWRRFRVLRDLLSGMPSAPDEPRNVPPGIGSIPKLADWLSANVTADDTASDTGDVSGGPVTVAEIRLIAGGRSNLTYYLRTQQRELVLRRP